MHNKTQFIVSGDGSHTIKNDLFDQYYHSVHGAIAESQVVFIDGCLDYLLVQGFKMVKIFEMGFGTGLNALMAYQFAKNNNIHIDFHTVEAFPIGYSDSLTLNYTDILGEKNIFELMHSTEWGKTIAMSSFFNFTKYHDRVEELSIPNNCHGIFFDAFAPTTQPNLWQQPILKKMYDCLLPNGVLTSYCAQGEFRRQLIACGFKTEKLPGPPFKREIMRAHKTMV